MSLAPNSTLQYADEDDVYLPYWTLCHGGGARLPLFATGATGWLWALCLYAHNAQATHSVSSTRPACSHQGQKSTIAPPAIVEALRLRPPCTSQDGSARPRNMERLLVLCDPNPPS